MRPVVISGKVLSGGRPITGVPRYEYEVLTYLDQFLEGQGFDVRLIYKKGTALKLPPLKNIRVIGLDGRGNFDLQIAPRYVKKSHALYFGLANDILLNPHGVVCLHDIRPIVMKGDAFLFRVKFFLHCITLRKNADVLVTDSEYQRQLIHEKLKFPLNRIRVLYCGWEHFAEVQEDSSILERLHVQGKPFFYALGSIAPHKNYEWICKAAAENPNETFVIAGGKNVRLFGAGSGVDKMPSNIVYAGYVSDAENKALMRSCKAFLQPSRFEGFGLPPLEAMSVGAKCLLSDATCLPELYGKCAVYFSPDDYHVDLEALVKQPVDSPDTLLAQYSWENVAKGWLALLCERTGDRVNH